MHGEWVAVGLAIVAIVQLVVCQLVVTRDSSSSASFLDRLIASDEQGELGLPSEEAQRVRLTDELFSISARATSAVSLIGSLLSATASLIAIAVISFVAKEPAAGVATTVSALLLLELGRRLRRRLRGGQLYGFAVGEPSKVWRKSTTTEPRFFWRAAGNLKAWLSIQRSQITHLETLTPYTTAVLLSGVLTTMLALVI